MISVIIPSYNRSKTIKRAIYSVLNQTYRNIELIIVDDCSTDDTEDVLYNIHDSRLRIIRHDKNQGACAARNTGINAAKGEYIAFQDSDDEWREKKLERQLDALKQYEADICFCKLERHNYPNELDALYPNIEPGVVPYSSLILNSLVSTQTILAKRVLFNDIFFDVEMKRMQDYDWIIRAAHDNRVCFVSEVLVDLYLQPDSLTSFDYNKLLASYIKFYSKYKNICIEYPEYHEMLLERIGRYKNRLGISALDEYRELFTLSKKPKIMIKLLMDAFHLTWLHKMIHTGGFI